MSNTPSLGYEFQILVPLNNPLYRLPLTSCSGIERRRLKFCWVGAKERSGSGVSSQALAGLTLDASAQTSMQAGGSLEYLMRAERVFTMEVLLGTSPAFCVSFYCFCGLVTLWITAGVK